MKNAGEPAVLRLYDLNGVGQEVLDGVVTEVGLATSYDVDTKFHPNGYYEVTIKHNDSSLTKAAARMLRKYLSSVGCVAVFEDVKLGHRASLNKLARQAERLALDDRVFLEALPSGSFRITAVGDGSHSDVQTLADCFLSKYPASERYRLAPVGRQVSEASL